MLAGVIAFLVAYYMAQKKLAAFTLPAYKHGWNLDEKAQACRRAGSAYLLCAVLVVVAPTLQAVFPRCAVLERCFECCCRHLVCGLRKVQRQCSEKRALLGYTKDSDFSDDEELVGRPDGTMRRQRM